MSENKIDVKIAGRVYPLTVENSEEKTQALDTAKELEKELSQINRSYNGSKDKQDILAMLAFKYKAMLLGKTIPQGAEPDNISNNQLEMLHKIDALLDTIEVS